MTHAGYPNDPRNQIAEVSGVANSTAKSLIFQRTGHHNPYLEDNYAK